jgi:hypothetical protein
VVLILKNYQQKSVSGGDACLASSLGLFAGWVLLSLQAITMGRLNLDSYINSHLWACFPTFWKNCFSISMGNPQHVASVGNMAKGMIEESTSKKSCRRSICDKSKS